MMWECEQLSRMSLRATYRPCFVSPVIDSALPSIHWLCFLLFLLLCCFFFGPAGAEHLCFFAFCLQYIDG